MLKLKKNGNLAMVDFSWINVLSQLLSKAWHENLLTDLTIVTQDETLHAHKLILVIASPYFRALLNTNLTESVTSRLELPNVNSAALKVVLQYMYSGDSNLTEENVTEVLALSEYFQIQQLKQLCCIFIKKHLTCSNYLQIYELAKLHQCPDLATYAFNLATKSCNDVICQNSFLQLESSTLEKLFSQSVLHVESENILFQALQSWLNYNPENRQNSYTKLLYLLHENQLSDDLRIALRNEMSKVSTSVLNYDKVAHSPIPRNFLKPNTKAKPRHRKEEELIMVFGGESSGRILGTCECIALGWSSWCCSIPQSDERNAVDHCEGERVIPTLKQARTHCAVAAKSNVVYVIGGQTSRQFLTSIEAYHVDSNEWSSFPDLPTSLHGEEAVFLRDRLYIVGGRGHSIEECESPLMVFDTYKEKWIYKSTMAENRAHFGAVALHGYLYVVGGFGIVQKNGFLTLDSCEKYDPDTDTWISIAPLNKRRSYHRVAVIDDYIYAVGGYDGSNWLNSVERYDPLKDRWSCVSPMLGTRSSFGITVSHGRIYCVGGFSGEVVLNAVEKYNPRTDMWHCVQSMRLRRYGLVAATVKVPMEKVGTS